MLLKDLLMDKSQNEKTAIKFKDDSLSYLELHYLSHSTSNIIRDSIIIMGNNIGIFLPNSIQYVIGYFSIAFLNRVIVPIEINIKKTEILSNIDYCDLSLIITNSRYKEILKSYLDDFDSNVIIFNLDDNSFEEIGLRKKNVTQKEELYESIDENKCAIMLHTSGTTSKPKRVMLTHKNIISNIKSNISSLKLTENDKVLIALPMFFGYCNTAQFLTHVYLGATIVIMDGMFIPKSFFKIVSDERITNFTGVPSMLIMLMKYRYKDKYDISSLRYVCFGGGTMPVEKLKEIIESFPSIGFVQTYGLTEAAPRVTALLPYKSREKIGSIGQPISNVTVRIVDERGRNVSIGQTGEIIVNGANIMKGYYKRHVETSKVIKDGWLYTGDLARYDEDGFIYLVGRKKNIIVCGGLNIYPEEIEELLMCHSDIKDVLVISENDDLLGEIPVAQVILKENCNVNEIVLINYCASTLADYKVPKRVYFVNKLNKTATGKVRRY